MACLALTGCRPGHSSDTEEDLEAKAMLQGVWVEALTEEVIFRVDGDSVYYPDGATLPSYFRILGSEIELGPLRYIIIKQTPHQFVFKNQMGDSVSLVKTDVPADSADFQPAEPEPVTMAQVVQIDSVVNYNGERYHWYIAVNPTKKKVVKLSYNDEGVGVENVFYDNIIHVSLFQGQNRLYTRDFNKQMYAGDVPQEFLSQAILSKIDYSHVDAAGFHFNATLCIPNEASCYMVETLVSFQGQLSMKLLEY